MIGGDQKLASYLVVFSALMMVSLSGCSNREAASPEGSEKQTANAQDVSVPGETSGEQQVESDVGSSVGVAHRSGDTNTATERTRSNQQSNATREQDERGSSPFYFQTVGAEHGLDFIRYEDIRGLCRILESTGGGVAMIDLDLDGWLDLSFTDGDVIITKSERDAGLPDEKLATIPHGGKLFWNRGAMQFEEVTARSGIQQLGHGQGCAVGDYDSDGFDDLYIAAFGKNALWHNNGDGTFSEVTDEAGVGVPSWSTSCAFADVNGDGLLDLYVANYLVDSADEPTLCPAVDAPTGFTQCPPSKYEGVDNVLLLNNGDGGFQDVTEATGLAGLKGKSLGVVIANFDNAGPLEIFVANDGEANFLLIATAGGSAGDLPIYQERGLAHGVALSRSGYAQASMGIAIGDIDGGGLLDIVLTHFYGDSNTVYRNLGDLRFEDVTRTTGLLGPSKQVLGWGTVLEDLDMDGDQDLLVVNGHVADREWLPHPESFAMPPQVFVNQGRGRFEEASRGAGEFFGKNWKGRGLAVGDIDRDGRVDFAVSNMLEPAAVLWNQTPKSRAAVQLQFIGVDSDRNAVGVVAEILGKNGEPLSTSQIASGEGFQASSERAVRFPALDSAVSLRVSWPSGFEETYAWPAPGDYVVIEQRGIISR